MFYILERFPSIFRNNRTDIFPSFVKFDVVSYQINICVEI